jgi:hypothetical protein
MKSKNDHVMPGGRILATLIPVLLLVFLALLPPTALSLDILIGSSQLGTFNHRTGRALCQLINTHADDLKCSVAPSEAGLHSSDSIHTLTNVLSGGLDLGIVDSSVQYDAANRTGQFAYFDFSFDHLRSLFSLNGIPFTVAARGGEELYTFASLEGKKVNVGNPGSTQRAVMDRLMQAKGWQKKDFLLMEELPAIQAQDTLALCFGTVDAIVRFDAHPNADTKHIVDLCEARLLNISDADIDKLINDNPYFVKLLIPASAYASIREEVVTFGLLETVVTTEDLDDESAYLLVKSVFENLDWLRSLHSAFSLLAPTDMHGRGLSVPLHPGALKYYREQGWIP